MDRLRKIFYVVMPIAAFSYLGYEVMSDEVANGMTRRGKAGHDLLVWLSNTLGPLPAGLLLIAIGLLLSVLAYRSP